MTEQQLLMTGIIGKQLFSPEKEMTDFGQVDWDALLTEAGKQAMLSIVLSYAEDKMPEDEAKSKFHKLNSTVTANSIRNRYYHYKLHELLEENNIPYVILKGQASARYYPEPLLRGTGDVDFLVDRKDAEFVGRLLTDRGFVKSSKADKHVYHWEYNKGKIRMELHWDPPGLPLEENSTSRKYLSDILDRRELIENPDGSYYAPSDFHHGVVLLLHMISHITASGVGIRHLCDWLVFEHSMTEESFVSMFSGPLKEIGLWTFAKVLTRIGSLYFGCEERKWCIDADESVCTAFLEDIFKGGNFGVKDINRKSQVMLIQNKTSKKVGSRDILRNALLSVDKRATTDYPACKRIPVIRPFIWGFVVIQYIVRVSQGSRRNMFKKEMISEAIDRKSLYAKLKLFEKQQ